MAKLLNRTKNRKLVTCALSNINKMACFYARAQCVLLFLILAGNSAQFRISCSYTLLLKLPVLCALGLRHEVLDDYLHCYQGVGSEIGFWWEWRGFQGFSRLLVILKPWLYQLVSCWTGAESVRFKAEVNFDGREVAKAHVQRLDLEVLLKVSCV